MKPKARLTIAAAQRRSSGENIISPSSKHSRTSVSGLVAGRTRWPAEARATHSSGVTSPGAMRTEWQAEMAALGVSDSDALLQSCNSLHVSHTDAGRGSGAAVAMASPCDIIIMPNVLLQKLFSYVLMRTHRQTPARGRSLRSSAAVRCPAA